MSNIEILFELVIRILGDVRANQPADGVYLFAQTSGNQASVLAAAKQPLDQGLAPKVMMSKSGAKPGYPGFEVWREQLLALGINDGQIQGIDIGDTPNLNTLIEAQALIKFASQHGLTHLYVTASPFHQTRAFMTAVTVVLREYPRLKIYSYPGTVLSWHEEVSHSQDTVIAPRKDLIRAELERIEKYRRKGDLAHFGEVLDYLNRRDL